MRRLTVETRNGNVSEASAQEARWYAKSGSYRTDYNSPPSRLTPGGNMQSGRYAAFKQGSVSVVGPRGPLPR